MEAPFGAEDEYHVATHWDLAATNDDARCGRHDGGSFFRKNVHALMGDGLAPRIVPKGVGVVVLFGGTGHGHGEGLGEEEAEEEEPH